VQELGGSIAGQIAKLANGNIPYYRCQVYDLRLAKGRKLSALLVSVSLNPLLSGSSNFFGSFAKIHEFGVPLLLLGD